MNLYGLIGFPLEHSFSPEYFRNKFEIENIRNSVYNLFPLENIEDIKVLRAKETFLKGLNVTSPHKEKIIPFLDELDTISTAIGAVNTIKCMPNGKWYGYNTDVWGFGKAILPMLESKPIKALVLGKGGASKAIQFVLSKLEIPFQLVSREKTSAAICYEEINEEIMIENSLLINCTPLGTFPNVEEIPAVPYQYINSSHFVFDLVYNPSESKLLREAKRRGAKTKNGVDMLKEQAEESWRIWNE